MYCPTGRVLLLPTRHDGRHGRQSSHADPIILLPRLPLQTPTGGGEQDDRTRLPPRHGSLHLEEARRC